MTIDTVTMIMLRIAEARPDSPIAVFKSGIPGKLDAMFASTLVTSEAIRGGHPDLVGVFDKTSNKTHVLNQLQHALEN